MQLSQLETTKGLPDLPSLYVNHHAFVLALLRYLLDAEGNGDSISAAVQAERIALLTSVLAQTQGSSGSSNLTVPGGSSPAPTHAAPRSHSLTPPQARRPVIELSPPRPHRSHALHSLAPAPPTRSVHRSQSHFSLGQQFANQSPQFTTAPSPIYQTSGHAHAQQQPQPQSRQPSPLSPLYSTGPDVYHQHVSHRNTINFIPNANHRQQQNDDINMNLHLNASAHIHGNNNFHDATTTSTAAAHNITHFTTPHVTVQAPAPLLPSFLQDIVQSPALSPTSTTTSSGDLSSVEEYEDLSTSPRAIFPRARGDSGSSDMISQNSPIANIWRLDGEESKSLSAFPLPNRQELAVGVRKTSREVLRV